MAEGALVIACGALARDILAVIRRHGWSSIQVECLPASWHNTPARIPEGVREKLRAARGRFARVFVAYGDCGTGGLLDAVLAEEGVERLPGAHCYEFFAGSETFAALHDDEPGTFYLTDYLARHFETLVIKGLGIDRHPELQPLYFGNYRRLVYLSQAGDRALEAGARAAARRLGLAFEMRTTGYGALEPFLARAAAEPSGQDSRPQAVP